MGRYLGNQIIMGNLEYSEVVTAKPTLKASIDTYLTAHGKANLIVQ